MPYLNTAAFASPELPLLEWVGVVLLLVVIWFFDPLSKAVTALWRTWKGK